jgi:hypothetical protein
LAFCGRRVGPSKMQTGVMEKRWRRDMRKRYQSSRGGWSGFPWWNLAGVGVDRCD